MVLSHPAKFQLITTTRSCFFRTVFVEILRPPLLALVPEAGLRMSGSDVRGSLQTCCLHMVTSHGKAFSSPEPTILLVCARDRDLWLGPKQEVRESRTSGFCAQPQKFETITVTIGYKWAAIALARYLAPARGLDAWRRPKRSWALGTRTTGK